MEKIKDISVRSRKTPLPDLRFTYFNLCRYFLKELDYPSLELIGKKVNRDHASVLHGLKKFDHLYGSNDFVGNKIYFKCIHRISGLDNEVIFDEILKADELKNIYRIKHIKLSEKYREVINKLNIKLRNYRKSDLIDRISNLNDEDLKDLEFKVDVFLKVKESLKKSA